MHTAFNVDYPLSEHHAKIAEGARVKMSNVVPVVCGPQLTDFGRTKRTLRSLSIFRFVRLECFVPEIFALKSRCRCNPPENRYRSFGSRFTGEISRILDAVFPI